MSLRALVPLALFVVLAMPAARAQASNVVVNHVGRLLSATDEPVREQKDLTVRLFVLAAPPNGAEAPVWEETYTVHPSSGHYALELGDTYRGTKKTLPSTIFATNPELYLEVAVDGAALSPRLRVGSVPFAADASHLGGKPATAWATDEEVGGLLAIRDAAISAVEAAAFAKAGGAISGDVAVSGTATIGGQTTIGGNADVTGALTVGSSASVTGLLSGAGAVFSGALSVGGDLGAVNVAASEAVTAKTLAVSGAATVSTLNASGTVTAKALAATDSLSTKTLTASGASSFQAVTATLFTGPGGGLTGVPAASLVGNATLPLGVIPTGVVAADGDKLVKANNPRFPANERIGKLLVHSAGQNAPQSTWGRSVHLNGTSLGVDNGRGLNVLRIRRSDHSKVEAKTFDTYGVAATVPELITYLNAIPDTEFVVVSASDAWTEHFTAAAHAALRRCGARLSHQGGHRWNYILVGICGDQMSGVERLSDSQYGPQNASVLLLDGEIYGR